MKGKLCSIITKITTMLLVLASGFIYAYNYPEKDNTSVIENIAGQSGKSAEAVTEKAEERTEAAGGSEKSAEAVTEKAEERAEAAGKSEETAEAVSEKAEERAEAAGKSEESVEVEDKPEESAEAVTEKLEEMTETAKKMNKPAEMAGQDDNTCRININTASAEELMQLKGIGQKRAECIIDFRKRNGDYKNIEDIMKVPGIKAGLFNKIKNAISTG